MASTTGVPFATSNDTTVGSVAWTRADGDLTAYDSVESSVGLSSGNQSRYLMGLSIGSLGTPISVPSGATINGVEVTITRRVSNAAGGMYPSIRDASLMVFDGAVFLGEDKADTSTDWTTPATSITYGGPTDVWALSSSTWATILANPSWGLGLSLSASGGISPATAYVDQVIVTVYYTEGPAPAVPQGGEYVEAGFVEERAWTDLVASGIAGDDYNAPPSSDAVTLRQATSAQFDELELIDAPTYADAGSASMLDGLADAMVGVAAQLPDENDEQPASGEELVGAAWLSDGVICDCPGFALITASGYGMAIVRGYGAGTGEAQSFGTATIVGGYGTAKITTSCTC